MDELIGTELGGCRIESLIGEGILGSTYKGVQLSLNRPVALKIFHSSVSGNTEYMERMKNEAGIISSLNHPNIVQIFDTGHKHDLDYMIMEYIEADTIRKAVMQKEPFSLEQAVNICLKIGEGLDKAHDKEIIHGTISPDTVFTVGTGTVKISDFGLAKGSKEAASLIEAGIQIGNPAFMSPEQCRKEDIDLGSDIYSLGCAFYFMLTCSAPYTGENAREIIGKHVNGSIPVISRIGSDTNTFISKCMAKDPKDRFSSYAEMLDSLKNVSLEETAPAGEDEQGAADFDKPARLGGAEGEHSCPKCEHSFNGEKDFYGKVTCSKCLFAFEPGEAAGEFLGKGPQTEMFEKMLEDDPEEETQEEAPVKEEESGGEETLLDKVNRVIVIQPREALETASSILEKLIKQDHASGILLPEDVVFGEDGDISVSEASVSFEDLTAEQASFASPELCRGETPEPSSDIYSLGMLLIFMISGHPPAAGNDLEAVKGFHEGDKDIHIAKMNPAVSLSYARIIHMMLGMNGEERFASFDEVLELLHNELKRMDGEDIQDRVTESPAPDKGDEEEEKDEDDGYDEEGSQAEAAQEEVRIVCTRCEQFNSPETFVCESCGKLLREENPSKEPKTEKEFVQVAYQLHSLGNNDTALHMCNEGFKLYFSSVDLKDLEKKIKDRMQTDIIGKYNNKAAEFASANKYKQAIKEWGQAGSLSPEAKLKNTDKIAWARSKLFRKRIVIWLICFFVVISAVVIFTVLYPQNVFPFLSKYCKKAG
ncbi:protein kinase, partial [Planctomycetota bacterium]